MEIKINLTDAEYKAMQYIAISPEEWVQNAACSRASIAMEEIFQLEVQRMIADPATTEIPADKEAVVLASELPSAAERNQHYLDSIATSEQESKLAAIDFPDSPVVNEEFTVGDRTWIWTGTVWKAKILDPLELAVDGGTAQL